MGLFCRPFSSYLFPPALFSSFLSWVGSPAGGFLLTGGGGGGLGRQTASYPSVWVIFPTMFVRSLGSCVCVDSLFPGGGVYIPAPLCLNLSV